MVTLDAPAKINLCLAVVGKTEKMHLLDGVFCSVPFLADEVRLEKADDVTVTYLDGRTYPVDTARIVAEKIRDLYGVGARIVIDKRIPEGAGLGGSSTDAGAVARGMRLLYDLPGIDPALLLSVGSDVPYCYAGGVKRVRGTGDLVTDADLPSFSLAILAPRSRVETAACYALYDEIGGETGDVDAFLAGAGKGVFAPFNALRRASERLNPDVAEGIRLLTEAGFRAGLSGSGSATFGIETDRGIYENNVRRLKERAERKGFRVYAQ